jgi:hypothetical protein
MTRRTYSGPIFVTDIDETLRDDIQTRVRGARTIVWRVARLGVPIIYLTAAEAVALRAINRRFLRAFPSGLLLDRAPNDESPNEVYKARRLRYIAEAYPRATFVCMGDNLTGDAIAYQQCRRGYSFIRKVTRWTTDNTPRRRSLPMLVYRSYTRSVQRIIIHTVRSLLSSRDDDPHQKVLRFPNDTFGIRVGKTV